MNSENLEALLALDHTKRMAIFARLSEDEQKELEHHWRFWGRNEQVAPRGDWRIWLILAGRGFGKTRAGAEWVREVTESDPAARIALVAGSLGDAASSPAVRTVIGVDPPASSGGDACGIVVAALGEDGLARVLADVSVARPTPNVGPGPSPWRRGPGRPTGSSPRATRAGRW